ncbi:MAG: hypothetical protein WCY75_01730 [Sulfurimonadaceae bacterium]|jgi:hypothetical protein
MKKLLIFLAMVVLFTTAHATQEKEGFLTTKWCADRGLFADCRLETVFCGYEGCFKDEKEFKTDVNATFVLNVHSEGKYYLVEFQEGIEMGEVLKQAINKNEVTLIGEINHNTIKAQSFKAPPPPKKSFFKGCL